MGATYNPGLQYLPWLTPITSELTDRLLLADQPKTATVGPGAFVRKTIKGKLYWYIQWSADGHQRQTYFGPDLPDEALRRQAIRDAWRHQQVAVQGRAELCAMLRAGQTLPPPAAPTSRLLVALDKLGLHHSGAVVIGTFAFLAYQGLLGVKWPAQLAETQDVDLASEPAVWLITPQNVELWPLLQQFGLQPTAPVDQLRPTTFVSPSADMRVDIIAPLRGRTDLKPIHLPNLGVAGAPLRFIDHLIGDPILVALPLGTGVLTLVPQPARFAVHKLLVAPYRKREDKRRKDLAQAEWLLLLLAQSQPQAIVDAVACLPLAPWRRKVGHAVEKLRPEIRDLVLPILAGSGGL